MYFGLSYSTLFYSIIRWCANDWLICTFKNWNSLVIFFVVYLNINQLDALNFIMRLFHASTCFEHHVLIVRRSKLCYTASGIITPIDGPPVHGTATYRCDDTRGCIVQFCPPDDEHMCSKHVEAWNKLVIIFSASSWLILR